MGIKEVVASIVSLDRLSSDNRLNDELELLEPNPDSDYNSAVDYDDVEDYRGVGAAAPKDHLC